MYKCVKDVSTAHLMPCIRHEIGLGNFRASFKPLTFRCVLSKLLFSLSKTENPTC